MKNIIYTIKTNKLLFFIILFIIIGLIVYNYYVKDEPQPIIEHEPKKCLQKIKKVIKQSTS